MFYTLFIFQWQAKDHSGNNGLKVTGGAPREEGGCMPGEEKNDNGDNEGDISMQLSPIAGSEAFLTAGAEASSGATGNGEIGLSNILRFDSKNSNTKNGNANYDNGNGNGNGYGTFLSSSSNSRIGAAKSPTGHYSNVSKQVKHDHDDDDTTV
jgi:hypothetical protein